MAMKNKMRTQYVLDALMTGKSLLPSDIARMVADVSGEETKIQAISTLMIKLSNSLAFPIGHFINKSKTPQGYNYSLVSEILKLAPEEIYDLTRNIDKSWFTLEMVVKKIPELRQYVKKTIKRKTRYQKPAKRKYKSKVKISAGKLKGTEEKPVLEEDAKHTEPLIQAATVEDVVAIFLNEIEKIGGLKVNLIWNVRRLKR